MGNISDAPPNVTAMSIQSKSIGGALSALSSNSDLISLELSGCTNIDGNVSALSSLSLTKYAVKSTKVSGSLSSFSGMTTLRILNVANTAITGDTSDLAGLTNLTTFNYANTAITGTWPLT
jgi:hypothetical protein